MKLISSLAVALAATMAVSSFAYAKECTRPNKPTIPNGATATDEAMKATQAKLTPYASGMSAYLRCLSDEIKSGKDEYDQVTGEWKAQSEVFVKTPAKPAQ